MHYFGSTMRFHVGIRDRPVPVDFHAVPDPGRVEFETMEIANALKHEYRPLPTAYFGHEDQFIRIALHLYFRATLAAVETMPKRLCAGRRSCMSSE